jgi:hypothetical protein
LRDKMSPYMLLIAAFAACCQAHAAALVAKILETQAQS